MAAGWSFVSAAAVAAQGVAGRDSQLRLAPFRFDVTPPLGHSLCGGWIKPVVAVDDVLECVGFVLLGAGEPIVVCAVDWTGLLNEAHVRWRTALAEAAGTTAERVAVQCVHQHNAPFACLDAQQAVQQYAELPHIVDVDFFAECLRRGRAAVCEALAHARPVTHVACGQAEVQEVASNRRVARDAEGRVIASRTSSCRDPQLRALPEGSIDPYLKTVAFYDRGEKIAACHYYTTHPMSYYGDGRVSSDFAGLARKRRQSDEPACLHVYFTGCAGDVTAGKYNDGSPETRQVLAQRLYDGMLRSEENLQPQPIQDVAWQAVNVLPPPRADLSADELLRQIGDGTKSGADRGRAAFMLGWMRRFERQTPLVMSSLHVNGVSLLHMPAECFVAYQLRAQSLQPDRFVAVAGYGDGGPWYVPTREEYPAGGYEVSVAFCDPQIDSLLTDAMTRLLR